MRARLRWSLAIVLHASAALAQTDQRAAAQVLFDQGKSLVTRGKFAEACPKFAESKRLDPGIGTMLWLADCLENNGQTASAWAEFKEAAAAAALRRDGREKIARGRADELAPKLSFLTITVPSPDARVEVRRDDVAVGPAEWGVAVPVDPGKHTVAASAPGQRAWSTAVQIPERGGSTSVAVPALEPVADAAPDVHSAAAGAEDGASAEPGAPSAPLATAPPREVQPTAPRAGVTQRTIGLGVAGVGVVGVGLSLVFGLRAMSTYNDSNTNGHCLPDNECDSTGKDDRSNARTLAAVSTVAFIAGAAALAGGVYLYFSAPSGNTRAIALAPLVSRGAGGLTLNAAF
jgi:hypothetical protein